MQLRSNLSDPKDSENSLKIGWFPLPRVAIERIIEKPKHLKLFCILSDKCVKKFQDEFYYYGLDFVDVQEGTVFFTLKDLSKALGCGQDNVENLLADLYRNGLISYLLIETKLVDSLSFERGLNHGDIFDDGNITCATQVILPYKRFIRIPNDFSNLPEERLRLLLYVRSKAKYRNTISKRTYKGKRYEIRHGSFIASYAEVARALRPDDGSYRRQVQRIANWGLTEGYFKAIPTRGSNHWSVVLDDF